MKTQLRMITTAVLLMLSGPALAQADEHHPDATEVPAEMAPAPEGAMGDIQAQCAAMMPMMQQMMTMMQEGMMQGDMMGGAADLDRPPMEGMSEASRVYMDAMNMMRAPIMDGAQNANPDVGFVEAMIAHHEGAIAMAEGVLLYGADADVKAWANEIIAAQAAEIDKLRDWLSRQVR